jgi:hypothetical protein
MSRFLSQGLLTWVCSASVTIVRVIAQYGPNMLFVGRQFPLSHFPEDLVAHFDFKALLTHLAERLRVMAHLADFDAV